MAKVWNNGEIVYAADLTRLEAGAEKGEQAVPQSDLEGDVNTLVQGPSSIRTTLNGAFVSGTDSRLSDARTPTAHTHPASAISDSTTPGRALLTAADAAAQRTSLGLGAAATLAVGTSAGQVAAGDDLRFPMIRVIKWNGANYIYRGVAVAAPPAWVVIQFWISVNDSLAPAPPTEFALTDDIWFAHEDAA